MIRNRTALNMKMAERGYSYNQLAKEIGMSTTTLNNKLNHELDFRIKEAEAIAGVLNMTQAEFIDIFIGRTFA